MVRLGVFGVAGIAVVLVLAGAGWLLSLPPAPEFVVAQPIAPAETEHVVAALKASKRTRPLVAIVGMNDATETTDYLMPYGILKRADVADVMLIATQAAPVTLFPALKVEPQASIASFDEQHPDGADYVIVPAMSRDDDPAVLAWIKAQAAKGAIMIGVCAGAKVVASAGLLDGKRATTHWYYLDELRKRHPSIRYVPDRRIIVDGKVVTTTGITASMPLSLTLIEAIAGHDKAQAVANELGLAAWDARHASDAFKFTRPFAWTAIRNAVVFWNHETLGLALDRGVDEVALALAADAWSRTYRSRAVTFANDVQETKNGLRIVPDAAAPNWPAGRHLPNITGKPVEALDAALDGIAARYGKSTAAFVAMQLEYPR